MFAHVSVVVLGNPGKHTRRTRFDDIQCSKVAGVLKPSIVRNSFGWRGRAEAAMWPTGRLLDAKLLQAKLWDDSPGAGAGAECRNAEEVIEEDRL